MTSELLDVPEGVDVDLVEERLEIVSQFIGPVVVPIAGRHVPVVLQTIQPSLTLSAEPRCRCVWEPPESPLFFEIPTSIQTRPPDERSALDRVSTLCAVARTTSGHPIIDMTHSRNQTAPFERTSSRDLLTDGGREFGLPGDDIWTRFQESDIGVGDVVVDLVRGKSLQVVSVATQTAGEHENVRSDRTAAMFDTDDEDLVFNCVFLPDGEGSISPPRKTYAYPESRLLRYPVEDATSTQRLQREWLSNVLEDLAVTAARLDEDHIDALVEVIGEVYGESVARTLEEFADAAGGESA